MDSEKALEGLARLRVIMAATPSVLKEIDPEQAAAKPSNNWSKKEELGHLIDSAANNHQRIVRAQEEDNLTLPDYDGDAWVRINRYQERDWNQIIDTWVTFNRQLLSAAEQTPVAAWSHICTIGGDSPVTLSFVLTDYVTHLLHHLGRIGVAPEATEAAGYPLKPAPLTHSIHSLLADRWSPTAFAEGRPVERSKIRRLLEAARWAPSCFNEQPWRYLVFDGTDSEALDRARKCLVEGNAWALKAPVLMLSVAGEFFERNGKPNRHAQHDVGLASENLVLQAQEVGLVAHQMAGFDSDRARAEFGIPPEYTPMAMIAVGYPYRGKVEDLPEKLRERDLAPRGRKALGEVAFAGSWGVPYEIG